MRGEKLPHLPASPRAFAETEHSPGLPERLQPGRNPPRDLSPTAVYELGALSPVLAPSPTPASGVSCLWGLAPTHPQTHTYTQPQPSHLQDRPPWAPSLGPLSRVPSGGTVTWAESGAFPGRPQSLLLEGPVRSPPLSGRCSGFLPASSLFRHPWCSAKTGTGSRPGRIRALPSHPPCPPAHTPETPRSESYRCMQSPTPGTVTCSRRTRDKPFEEAHSLPHPIPPSQP